MDMKQKSLGSVQTQTLIYLSPGIIGGKFLERDRVKKPGQIPYSTELSQYYMAPDLFVGATVSFNQHKFILIDADEYAFRYMEEHPLEVRGHCVVLQYVGLIDGATRGVIVRMSAFLACHQWYSAGSSLGWDLNFQAVVCGLSGARC